MVNTIVRCEVGGQINCPYYWLERGICRAPILTVNPQGVCKELSTGLLVKSNEWNESTYDFEENN